MYFADLWEGFTHMLFWYGFGTFVYEQVNISSYGFGEEVNPSVCKFGECGEKQNIVSQPTRAYMAML